METILVTGASRRIGSKISECLGEAGHFVWVHYHSHKAEAESLCEFICQKGGKADCVSADLSDTDQIDGMLHQISRSPNGKLTTLINNASVFPRERLSETKVEEWDHIMNVNLKAVWYLSECFQKNFLSASRIINIGDASVSSGMPGHAVYSLSKFALKYLTSQMAVAYAPKIRVNLLSPGVVLKGDKEQDCSWERRLSYTLTDNSEIVNSLLKCIMFLMEDPGMTGSELIVDNGLRFGTKK